MASLEWTRYVYANLQMGGFNRGGARDAVIDLLGEQRCALSAAQIEDRLRGEGRPIARASIYRTLDLLVDRGYGTTTKGFEGPEGVAKMNHSTGHGVGLDVHEEPALRGPSDDALMEGDVVTVEPGLYLLGLGGVRIEDAGMVTKDGFSNFTTITRSLDPKDYL